MRQPWVAIAGVVFLLAAAPWSAAQEPGSDPARAKLVSTSCTVCHLELGDEMAAPVEGFAADVHALAGLGCHDCHGGDPSIELAEDVDAMDPARGYRGSPSRLEVADFCARCHADLGYMRRFNPQARVDQLTEYRQSTHGRRNAEGDPVPATCIDCHGVHGIRPVSSPDSRVYAKNVPETCASCHSDAEKMAAYGIPTTPYTDYKRSVHAAALLERGDTAAPACNDCHGNHGAAPPGLTSVANVCGQCHGREATLFRASFKKELFDSLEVPECSSCHQHHLVRHPTPMMFRSESKPVASQGVIEGTDPLVVNLGALQAGTPATVTWTSVLAPHLAADDERLAHRLEISVGDGPPLVLDATVRPGESPSVIDPRTVENEALQASLVVAPVAGGPVERGDPLTLQLTLTAVATDGGAVVVRDVPGTSSHVHQGSVCLTCHTRGDACDVATEQIYDGLRALDRDLREASALLHRAEVAGMEVSSPLFALKSKGRTAAIESRALIHSFEPPRVLERTGEGAAVAAEALQAGRDALEELQVRRRGLAVSLVFVALVLVALGLKIREVDRVHPVR